MKRILSLFTLIVLALTTAACGTKQAPETDRTTTPPPAVESTTTAPAIAANTTTDASEEATTTDPSVELTRPPAAGTTLELETISIAVPDGIEETKNVFDEPMLRDPGVFRVTFIVEDAPYEDTVIMWEEGTSTNEGFVKKELTIDGQPATILGYLTDTGTDVHVYIRQSDGNVLDLFFLEDDFSKKTAPADLIELDTFKALLEGITVK
jgi:predicted small lipoprotein YifL